MTSYINLTQGKVAIVDDELFEELNKHKWYAHKSGNNFYGRRDTGGRRYKQRVYLHRQIARMLGFDLSFHVDHRDGNGLNNQSNNLRAASICQNMRNQRRRTDNTSGFKGVSYSKKICKWVAEITVSNKKHSLGQYATPVAAAVAYDKAATKLHGEFAKLNYPVV